MNVEGWTRLRETMFSRKSGVNSGPRGVVRIA
jgi:hypothetical protein